MNDNSLTEAARHYNSQRSCKDKSKLCHAPFSAMYFGRNGVVGACCYNRSQFYGIYPQQSISEIWHSSARETMKSEVGEDRIPEGCMLCVAPLEAGNFKNLLASNFDAFAKPQPSLLGRWWQRLLNAPPPPDFPQKMEFELSNTCNLECAMCSGMFSSSIRRNRENLPPLVDVYDDAFVEQLRPFVPHLKHAGFFGGEPFLIPIYHKIWDLMIESGSKAQIDITTNATVLNERVKRVLEKLDCQLVLSIDSIVKETYSAIRINADYDRVMENIEYFIEACRKRGKLLSFAVCPMSLNALEMPELVEYCNRRNLTIGFNVVTNPATLSLKNQRNEFLKEVLAVYDAYQPRLTNYVQECNFERFRDLRNMVAYWHEHRLRYENEVWYRHLADRTELSNADTLDALMALLMMQHARNDTHIDTTAMRAYFGNYTNSKSVYLEYVDAGFRVFAEIHEWDKETRTKKKSNMDERKAHYLELFDETKLNLDFLMTQNPLLVMNFLTSD